MVGLLIEHHSTSLDASTTVKATNIRVKNDLCGKYRLVSVFSMLVRAPSFGAFAQKPQSSLSADTAV